MFWALNQDNISMFLLKQTLKLHNFAYRLASFLAIKAEQAVHPKHRLIGYHQFFLSQINSQDRVLDIGCGSGELAFDLAKKCQFVLGLDISSKNIHHAQQKHILPNLRFIETDILSFETKERFDAAALSNVLEHIKTRVEVLKKVKALAAKILIRVPLFNRDWITLYKKELGLEYRLDKTHQVEYTFPTFQKEIEMAGLKIEFFSIQFGEIWAVCKNN